MKNKKQQLLIKTFNKNLIDRGYAGISDFIEIKDGRYEYKFGTKIEGDYCLIVINNFNLKQYLDLLFSFYAIINSETLALWYKTFTKSVFLIGNPANLTYKYKDSISVYSNDMCITKISNSKVLFGISKMLKSLSTKGIYNPDNISWTISGTTNNETKVHKLYIKSGQKLERYLVHLTHTIMENFINGNIRTVDEIKIINQKNLKIHKNSINTRVGINENNNRF